LEKSWLQLESHRLLDKHGFRHVQLQPTFEGQEEDWQESRRSLQHEVAWKTSAFKYFFYFHPEPWGR